DWGLCDWDQRAQRGSGWANAASDRIGARIQSLLHALDRRAQSGLSRFPLLARRGPRAAGALLPQADYRLSDRTGTGNRCRIPESYAPGVREAGTADKVPRGARRTSETNWTIDGRTQSIRAAGGAPA